MACTWITKLTAVLTVWSISGTAILQLPPIQLVLALPPGLQVAALGKDGTPVPPDQQAAVDPAVKSEGDVEGRTETEGEDEGTPEGGSAMASNPRKRMKRGVRMGVSLCLYLYFCFICRCKANISTMALTCQLPIYLWPHRKQHKHDSLSSSEGHVCRAL